MKIFEHPHFLIYILFSSCLLLCGCILGLILNSSPSTLHSFEDSPVITMTNFEVFKIVIIRNLIATFLIISLGIIGLRFIPMICMLFNGYTLGLTITTINYNQYLLFAIIFPHGYIEFPLLIFTVTCSLIIIEEIRKTKLNLYTLLTRHKNPNIKYILTNYLFYPYIFIISPGIFIAAIIESTFSYWNLKMIIGV